MRILSITLLILLTSCGTIPADNERAHLRVAQETFDGIMNTLLILRKEHKINDATKDKIVIIAGGIKDNLRLWATAVKAGRKAPDLRKAINIALNSLKQYQNLE